MNQIHVIRHKALVEGQSIRAIAKQMGLARNTIRKFLREGADGNPPHRKQRRAPAREAIEERATELLEEWSDKTTAKQRTTAARLHVELRREGYDVGVTTVQHVVSEWRRKRSESFIPLTYRPGEVAQCDFFEVVVDVEGKRRRVWMFLLRLMDSGRDFAWLYDRADQVSFLDAHVRAFAHFGGVPQRIVYDNLKAAVVKILRPGRELAPRFAAMVAHYVFEPCFARPGEGHDKGGVESRGKNIRLQHLTPIPRGRSLDEISATLLARLDAQAATKSSRDAMTVMQVFESERKHFIDLPQRPFEARRIVTCSVRRTARLHIEGAQYSVWSHWKMLNATVLIGPTTVEVRCRGEVVVHQRARFGESKILYRHYFAELAKKPQAVRQVMPELLGEIGEPFAELWKMLVDVSGPLAAARSFARVIDAVIQRGEAEVARSVRGALARDRLDLFDIVAPEPRSTVVVPATLSEFEIESASAADYDMLLEGER